MPIGFEILGILFTVDKRLSAIATNFMYGYLSTISSCEAKKPLNILLLTALRLLFLVVPKWVLKRSSVLSFPFLSFPFLSFPFLSFFSSSLIVGHQYLCLKL